MSQKKRIVYPKDFIEDVKSEIKKLAWHEQCSKQDFFFLVIQFVMLKSTIVHFIYFFFEGNPI